MIEPVVVRTLFNNFSISDAENVAHRHSKMGTGRGDAEEFLHLVTFENDIGDDPVSFGHCFRH